MLPRALQLQQEDDVNVLPQSFSVSFYAFSRDFDSENFPTPSQSPERPHSPNLARMMPQKRVMTDIRDWGPSGSASGQKAVPGRKTEARLRHCASTARLNPIIPARCQGGERAIETALTRHVYLTRLKHLKSPSTIAFLARGKAMGSDTSDC